MSASASPFNNGGSSCFGVEPSADSNEDARSDGAALRLLPLDGATLLTTLGPKTLGFRSSCTETPILILFPFPTLNNDDVDRFASEMEPVGFSVSSELRGDPAIG
jgi:hypothetical protein